MTIPEYHTLETASEFKDVAMVSVRFDGEGFVPPRNISLSSLLQALALGRQMSFDEHPATILGCEVDFKERRVLLVAKLDRRLDDR